MKRFASHWNRGRLFCFAGDRKQLPGQAGNDDVDLEGSVFLLTKRSPKRSAAISGKANRGPHEGDSQRRPPLRVGPDDFTIISRKDGQR